MDFFKSFISAVVMYDSVIHTHIHSLSDSFHIDYHRIVGGVLCAVRQVLAGQSFHGPQSAYANPKPPVHPSPPHPNVCCFKLVILWLFVTVAIEN